MESMPFENLIITGASGNLASMIMQLNVENPIFVKIHALKMEHETPVVEHKNITYFNGNILHKSSMRQIFENLDPAKTVLIHCAGLISIRYALNKKIYEVNVNGTRNILDLAEEYNIRRVVYLSSVHAIPAPNKPLLIAEQIRYYRKAVSGGYAKTKAEALEMIMDEYKGRLDIVTCQPSGIVGGLKSDGYLNHKLKDSAFKKKVLVVKGAFDFISADDVATGVILAALYGKSGETYILSDTKRSIKEVFQEAASIVGNTAQKLVELPMFLAKFAGIFNSIISSILKKTPSFTLYSLNTLSAKYSFSHNKATRELGFHPRGLQKSLKRLLLCNNI